MKLKESREMVFPGAELKDDASGNGHGNLREVDRCRAGAGLEGHLGHGTRSSWARQAGGS